MNKLKYLPSCITRKIEAFIPLGFLGTQNFMNRLVTGFLNFRYFMH